MCYDCNEETQDPWWVLVNVESGHSSTCSFAGAGDCTCEKGNIVAYLVTATGADGRSLPIELTEDHSQAVSFARTAQKTMNGVRLRRLRGHWSLDHFLDTLDRIEKQIVRVA